LSQSKAPAGSLQSGLCLHEGLHNLASGKARSGAVRVTVQIAPKSRDSTETALPCFFFLPGFWILEISRNLLISINQ
jgi:hypothetical protein